MKKILVIALPVFGDVLVCTPLLAALRRQYPDAKIDVLVRNNVGGTEGLRVIGAGHGLPAAPGAITDAIAYLNFQAQVFQDQATPEDAVAALTNAYPGYGAVALAMGRFLGSNDS